MKKEYQPLTVTEYGQNSIDQIRQAFSDLHEQMEKLAGPSRVRAIALTKLEEASHFAIRAIAEAHEVQ